jgi:hypothetical protein
MCVLQIELMPMIRNLELGIAEPIIKLSLIIGFRKVYDSETPGSFNAPAARWVRKQVMPIWPFAYLFHCRLIGGCYQLMIEV